MPHAESMCIPIHVFLPMEEEDEAEEEEGEEEQRCLQQYVSCQVDTSLNKTVDCKL